LTYADAKKRSRQIADITAKRVMPPWLPEPGYGHFKEERRLSEAELMLLQDWVKQGSLEGDPADLPQRPQWNSGWRLGKPDLVVQLPAYTLEAEGSDLYRNFVAPIPVERMRFVKAVEFRPGNSRAVHHAFINIDETRESRRLAAKQVPPGFDGMEVPQSAVMPGGHLLGWQPGKIPSAAPDGLAWVLKTNTDLVLQVHMNRTGKTEHVAPELGFYFTDVPPTNSAFRIKLTALELDIPAGATNYTVEQSYTLPVDLSLVRVGAHAHYLGKDLQGFAVLPNGEKKSLLWIKDWDFKWQGDYGYVEPVQLPKGSKLVMRFSYDNSTNNVRNPNNPPERVRWGIESNDEMGELYFQAVPASPVEYRTLAQHYGEYFVKVSLSYYQHRMKLDPGDAEAHARFGRAVAAAGMLDLGMKHLREAIRLKSDYDAAHFDLGMVFLHQKQFAEAYDRFQTVVRLNPDDAQAYGCLGIVCLQTGRFDEAETNLKRALAMNPQDQFAQRNLDILKRAREGRK
jgi:Tfp pilus assembly protein PilF